MKESYLIQRLQKPFAFKIKGKALDNPFCFGGGLLNGGLSDKAMDVLRDIFSFDYMGSAEFEFGAVPKALQTIAKDVKDYVAFTAPVKFSYKDWREKKAKTGEGDVHVICNKADVEEVLKRIREKAFNEYGGKKSFHTKECVRLDSAMANDANNRTVGWLELDNGYFFFTDKEMFGKVRELFGVKLEGA